MDRAWALIEYDFVMLGALGKKTVLVVDDEEHVRNITELMLSQFGLEVLTAEDGLDGIRQVEIAGDRIDLVIMDLTMPRMNGERAFRRMRDLRPDIQVLLTSGYNESEATSLGERGIVGFLQKPYELEDLLKAVKDALGDR
ncbi:MAG: response regulator [Acidobacteriota bacterium]